MNKIPFAVAAFLCIALAPADAGAAVKVVATSFPQYDWAREIVGSQTNEIELTLLQTNGADMHSYSPVASDVKKILTCDVLVCIGGESEEWLDKIAALGGNPSRKTVKLLDILGNDVPKDAHGDRDEHIWLSPRTAGKLVQPLADALAGAAPSCREALMENARNYGAKIAELDTRYVLRLSKYGRKTLVVADRFPLAYLAADYALDAEAAFSGCSAESEAGFKTVIRLARKADRADSNAIMILEGGNTKLAETVNRATRKKNLKVTVFDSMQSVRQADIDAGKTYCGTMERNLEVLIESLR